MNSLSAAVELETAAGDAAHLFASAATLVGKVNQKVEGKKRHGSQAIFNVMGDLEFDYPWYGASYTPLTPLLYGHTPLVHPSYTPHAPLLHPSYTPHTSLIHPSYTPLTPLIHPSYTPHTPTPLVHSSYTPHTPLIHPSASRPQHLLRLTAHGAHARWLLLVVALTWEIRRCWCSCV